MTESETVATEPVFGHRYTIEVYQDNSKLAEQLKKIRSDLGIESRDRTRVKIIEHDINWDEPKTLDMRKKYFDTLIEKYEDELEDE
jgi:ATP-dependent Lon protease